MAISRSRRGLRLNCLLRGATSIPTQGVVTTRELTPQNMPHLDLETLGALMTPEASRTDRQAELVAFSDALIDEVEAADTIVLAVPMYNFSIPSALKAWIDHIVRAGRTFRYTEAGPIGLLKGKKVFVVTARGGVYSGGSPAEGLDFQAPYLRAILGFIGIDDVTFIHLEGLKVSAEMADGGRTAVPRAAIGALGLGMGRSVIASPRVRVDSGRGLPSGRLMLGCGVSAMSQLALPGGWWYQSESELGSEIWRADDWVAVTGWGFRRLGSVSFPVWCDDEAAG